MRRVWAATIVAFVLSLAAAAHAQPRGVRVRRAAAGDTFELLAAEYYGDRRHATLIRLESGMERDRQLQRGDRVRIPVGARVVTRAGERLTEVAAEHLGDGRRAEYLAEYNDLRPDAALHAGMLLRVPFHVGYTARERTSLRVVAAR